MVRTSPVFADDAFVRAQIPGSPDLNILDDYNGGASFMGFLAAEFGEDVHRRLLQSGETTYAAVLTAVTQPYSRIQLFARLPQRVESPR